MTLWPNNPAKRRAEVLEMVSVASALRTQPGKNCRHEEKIVKDFSCASGGYGLRSHYEIAISPQSAANLDKAYGR